jgi:hypothetical protein
MSQFLALPIVNVSSWAYHVGSSLAYYSWTCQGFVATIWAAVLPTFAGEVLLYFS